LPIDLSDAILVIAPGTRKAEAVNVKTERGLNVCHVQDGTREPIRHRLFLVE
jgi:hypothetical protein